jgi:hypothetical protein
MSHGKPFRSFLNPPLYRIEWRDAEDLMVQTSIIEQEEYDEYRLKDIVAIIREVGGAASVKFWLLDDYLNKQREEPGDAE